MRWLCVGVVLFACNLAGLSAQGAAAGRLIFLQGCWEADMPQGTVDEHWMAPRGDSLLGVSRTVKDGRLREYELTIIREREGHLIFDARPMGQPGGVFEATLLEDGKVVFENPTHDFPQRVGYERRGTDSLLAWIEGTHEGGLRRVEFPYRRVDCSAR